MANKAVFLDRDRTLMEDPGYVSDPDSVKLLPGVELALKSLAQAGYKLIVVTNQSGIARGMLTEETLEKIHDELRRQLAERGAHLDAIYYCPHHPDGALAGYAEDSELRKPKPGMLLKAAAELEIDLDNSWMVGDSGRDIEAGQRAGCRTVRVRTPSEETGTVEDEAAQADHTVRNLVDAARVILREANRSADAPADDDIETPEGGESVSQPDRPDESDKVASMDDTQVRREILRHVRQFSRTMHTEEFSLAKLFASILQVLVLLLLLVVFWKMLSDARIEVAILWALLAVVLQLMSLTFFTIHRNRNEP
ncbi:MAG: HAD family hydrolase [Planctomycetota bacterium]|nr:HAD family hydrolase [Planctomycetota bacterium]